MSEFGKLNNPAQRRVMRLKLHKRNEWKFISRIIPHKQVFNTPQLAAEPASEACFGVPVIFVKRWTDTIVTCIHECYALFHLVTGNRGIL